ncbi:hypothetical protein SKAU_G00234100 [Synaphobranchus kaupii]|uniref:guanylate cyclase n=1 Tax=Synaphobranchus kaupii TaxID=118154 RepID=A0A9Q1F695_SYNKA|nr:hypothetical protein SKAU_G00234100 [Synaphobranchus kaupii]
MENPPWGNCCECFYFCFKSRGQMVWMESLGCMVYLCSPKLRSLEEMQERGLHIADIAQHDTTRDLILLNQQRLAEIELSNQLERKKEELRILSRNLEVEKKKTETLLYAMLPRHVANQLKEGKKVEAGTAPPGSRVPSNRGSQNFTSEMATLWLSSPKQQ